MGVQLNLPDDLAERLEAEAQAGGCSLEQLILQRLQPLAGGPAALLERIRGHRDDMRAAGVSVEVDEIVEVIREDRDRR